MANMMLNVKNLSLYYGEHRALTDIHLDVEAKSITALIGPSGCGKSTFLRTLNRMNDLISGVRIEGEVRISGIDIYNDHVDVDMLRKTVGMVFQAPNPFPKSIFDNIAYGPRIHGIRNKKRLQEIVEQTLQDVGLWEEVKDRLSDNATGLSGGQQQRLCIARSLAVGPDVVLMDEPTSALDPVSTAKIEELVQQLKTQYTIIIVTHNMQQAARISDHTAFFLNGGVIEYSDTAKLFSNPENPRTEDYISGRFG